MEQLQGLLGFSFFFAIAYALSERREQIPWLMVLRSLLGLLVLALVFEYVPFVRVFLTGISNVAIVLDEASLAGTSFLFGQLGDNASGSSIFAFRVLPLVVIISSLAALLWHWRVLEWSVHMLGRFLQKSFGLSGVVGLAGGLSLFFGLAEIRYCSERT